MTADQFKILCYIISVSGCLSISAPYDCLILYARLLLLPLLLLVFMTGNKLYDEIYYPFESLLVTCLLYLLLSVAWLVQSMAAGHFYDISIFSVPNSVTYDCLLFSVTWLLAYCFQSNVGFSLYDCWSISDINFHPYGCLSISLANWLLSLTIFSVRHDCLLLSVTRLFL